MSSSRSADSVFSSRSATCCGSSPLAAMFESTSAQLTTLTAAPALRASTTTGAPSSSCNQAIKAEASRTEAGSTGAGSALGTAQFGPGGCGLGAGFGPCFPASLGDQLIRVGASRIVTKHSPHTFGCSPASLRRELGQGLLGGRGLLLGLGRPGDFDCLCHARNCSVPSGLWIQLPSQRLQAPAAGHLRDVRLPSA